MIIILLSYHFADTSSAAAFEIDPPGPSSLPPLPPIPQPPTTHHRRQSLQSPVRAPRRPISRPPVPSSHPLCRVETPSEAVKAYNGIGKGKAVLRHDNSAVYVDMGDGQGAAWILLDSLNDGGMRVESVKLYTGGEASEVSRGGSRTLREHRLTRGSRCRFIPHQALSH